MTTEFIKIRGLMENFDDFMRAGDILKNGGVVAIPTETVYGLAANALDEVAVGRIFEAKGRPQDNPLIVHISDFEDIANAVWYFGTDLSKNVTGSELVVDGGMMSQLTPRR
jgi:tRNA A37 threonylcarbamoyladenosine synthetase subunit TsaC/SUA5/YrdC